ncbi:MAG: DUF4399 domain-containing protein, partial [Chloroflexi bacterium]|nr:DUF4399 domain-containing protein [Chloroflexota bacterium]
TLDRPLLNNHTVGQFVGVEFVRYQWYSDAESGTTFYHNHVNGIPGFGIALTGALIQEPVGARWTNPATDAEVRSGSQVVIHTPTQVAAGIPAQDFREQVLHFMGSSFNIPRGAGGETGAVNMRQQPLSRLPGDPSLLFSSVTHADPETPVLNAYVGDLVTFRIMNSSGHDELAFHTAGHRFRLERNDAREEPKDSLSIGISERFDVFMTAGSVGLQAGDYAFMNGMHEKMMDGAWGILRVSDTLQPNLLPLQNVSPTHPPLRPPGPTTFPRNAPGVRGQLGPAPPAASEPADVAGLKAKLELNGYSLMGGLPVDQIPVRTYDVVAIQTNIAFSPTLTNGAGRAYVLAEDEAAVLAGTKPLEPLVLRANVGEIVRVNFTNNMTAARASFHVPQLIKTADSEGAAFGLDNDSTVAPGGSRTYWYVIDPRFEIPRSFVITDFGDPVNGRLNGLYGQFIVEPSGAIYLDPVTGVPVKSGTNVKVVSSSGNFTAFRDVVLLFHDDDVGMNRDVMPYRRDVTGIRGINYKAVPFAERLAVNPDVSKVFSSAVHGDPRTPVITVTAGDQVRLHVAGGVGQQPHVFSVDGHRFPFDINRAQFMNLASRQFAPGVTIDTLLEGGAGGISGLPGDYLYRDNRNPFLEAGMWGILRVQPSPFPTAPTTLAAPTVAFNQVVLTWNDSTNETSYRVERATGAGAFGIVAPSLSANSTSYTDTTVQPSTAYQFRVVAVNAAGESIGGPISVTTPAAPLPPPPPSGGGGGGGGGGGPSLTSLSLSGLEGDTTPSVNFIAATESAFKIHSTDGKVTIDIASGTVMRQPSGSPLNSMSLTAPATTPSAPPGNAIVLAQEFGPNGATFGPAITLTLAYSESALPSGASESQLVIAYWDGSQWVTLPTTVNAEANTVSAKVEHFTAFAIMAKLPPPAPAPAPAPPPPPPALAVASTVRITSPQANATLQPGNIVVNIEVGDFKIVPPGGDNVAGEGHVHYYLDTDIPVTPGRPAVTAAGTYKAVPATTATWENVAAGSHSLGVQLVNKNHTPLDPPVVAKITVTVSAPPAPALTPTPTPQPTPAPEAPAGPNWGMIAGIIAVIVALALVLYFVRRRRVET